MTIQRRPTPCAACVKAKNMLRLVGGDQVRTLFDHVGIVTVTDNLEKSLGKVTAGIKKQTNQAAAKFKLIQKMPQSDSCFAEWYPLVKEQAERCNWVGYNDPAQREVSFWGEGGAVVWACVQQARRECGPCQGRDHQGLGQT